MKKETDTKPIFKTKLRFLPKLPIKKKKPMPSRIVPTSIKEASIVADLFQQMKITKTNPDFGMRMSKMEKEVKETDTKSASVAKRTTNTKEEPIDADLVVCLTKLRFMPNIFTRKKPTSQKDSTNMEESIDAALLDCLKIVETNVGFFTRMSKMEDKVKEINTKSASIPKLKFSAKIPHKKKSMLPKIGSTNIKEEPIDTNASLGLGRRIPKTEEKVKAHAEQISFGATICDVSGSFAGLSLSKMDKEEDQLNFVDSMLDSMNLKTS